MLTSSFIFAKGMSEELERALWAHGLTSWALVRRHPEEATAVLGPARAQRLLEAIGAAEKACEARDLAHFRASWPAAMLWRLWRGYVAPERIALVDIETTGLTPGYDQITVIGLADAAGARAFVSGRPQGADAGLDAFPAAIRAYDLVATFNGTAFDLPFIERHFKDSGFRFEMPHLDLMLFARGLGMGGGLKDMEKQVGIVRDKQVQGVDGRAAIDLWAQWKHGDHAALAKLVAYCKADCANLRAFADHLYDRKWKVCHLDCAKQVDFTAIKGQQLSLF